jgi:hypothetical protein
MAERSTIPWRDASGSRAVRSLLSAESRDDGRARRSPRLCSLPQAAGSGAGRARRLRRGCGPPWWKPLAMAGSSSRCPASLSSSAPRLIHPGSGLRESSPRSPMVDAANCHRVSGLSYHEALTRTGGRRPVTEVGGSQPWGRSAIGQPEPVIVPLTGTTARGDPRSWCARSCHAPVARFSPTLNSPRPTRRSKSAGQSGPGVRAGLCSRPAGQALRRAATGSGEGCPRSSDAAAKRSAPKPVS